MAPVALFHQKKSSVIVLLKIKCLSPAKEKKNGCNRDNILQQSFLNKDNF